MIYEKVAQLCDSAHISIWALEKKLGLSHGAIARWKTMKPRAETLFKVAQYFSLNMEYFMMDNKNETNDG